MDFCHSCLPSRRFITLLTLPGHLIVLYHLILLLSTSPLLSIPRVFLPSLPTILITKADV
jgi:hypothetical protein